MLKTIKSTIPSLLFALRNLFKGRKNNENERVPMKLQLEKYVDRVLILDDMPEDSKNLADQLWKVEVSSDIYTPESIKGQKFHKNRQLLFFDLYMNKEFPNLTSSIAYIRQTLSDVLTFDFGAYGLVLWTEHEDDVDEVKDKLSIDRKNRSYNTPIFITSLSKLDYKEKGYDSLIDDLNAKLQNEITSSFFLSWGSFVKYGFDKTITDMYSHIVDYMQQDEKMRSLLLLMAQNHTGLPNGSVEDYAYLSEDTYRAMNEVLIAGINSNKLPGLDLYANNKKRGNFDTISEELALYSFINTQMFIKHSDLDANEVYPGNVYDVTNLPDTIRIKDIPKEAKAIAVELTPPCDYSNKKRLSRLVIGFLVECPQDNASIFKLEKLFKSDYGYRVWPINVDSQMVYLGFDFRHLVQIHDDELKDSQKYPLLFRFNHNLFADIIQKFSSHAARIGENILRPHIVDPELANKDILKGEKSFLVKVKDKLSKGNFTEDELNKILKARNIKKPEDVAFYKTLLDRMGILIEEGMVKYKQE